MVQQCAAHPGPANDHSQRVAEHPGPDRQCAKARIKGIEFEGGLAVGGFELTAYFAYNDTYYTQFCDTSSKDPRTGGACLDRSKDLFPYAPKYNGGATARYTVPVDGRGTEISGMVNFSATAKFNTTAAQQPLFAILPAYALVNARLEATNINGSGLSAAVFVNNLFRRHYYTGASPVAGTGTAIQSIGAPRMWGAELTYRFGGER